MNQENEEKIIQECIAELESVLQLFKALETPYMADEEMYPDEERYLSGFEKNLIKILHPRIMSLLNNTQEP